MLVRRTVKCDARSLCLSVVLLNMTSVSYARACLGGSVG